VRFCVFVNLGRNFKIHRIIRWIDRVSSMFVQLIFLTLTELHRSSVYTHVYYSFRVLHFIPQLQVVLRFLRKKLREISLPNLICDY
jgi:hypothetical protein